jgi:phosphatidylserine/phosphatidylglycerophosphate/cardiolipin synthase-like enzyme
LEATAARGVEILVAHLAGHDRDRLGASLAGSLRTANPTAAVRSIPAAESYPHLKLVLADSSIGYVGSANLTAAALTTNLEAGALVSGSGVGCLVSVFDDLWERAEAEPP